MSRELLLNYFDNLEQDLLKYPNAYVEIFRVTIINSERANLRLRIRFNLKYLLAVSEAIIVIDNQVSFIDYRYHFQDEDNHLIFRYDSTPHFPSLNTFPHHKHMPDDVIASDKPDLLQVISEVRKIID